MSVKNVMTVDVITVNENDTVEEAAKLLIENVISSLPVLDEKGNLVGIITEGDLIKRAARLSVPPVIELLGGFIYLENPKKYMDDVKRTIALEVGEVMTKKVITIDQEDTIEEAATVMVKRNLKRLPVVNNEGFLVGIISRRDILNHLYW